ncbi:MAG: hypothetical protein H0V51_09610 [Chloroflexi bacterium]|nr:hypothetical protein [Chloroflexota bacterium]
MDGRRVSSRYDGPEGPHLSWRALVRGTGEQFGRVRAALAHNATPRLLTSALTTGLLG